LDDVENNMKRMGVRCYRKIAGDMDVRKLILKETKMLHGPRSEWRRRKMRRRKKRRRRRRRKRGRRRKILRW